MHIAWIHDTPRALGGAEQYIVRTSQGLATKGVRNSLLFAAGQPIEQDFLAGFDAAFPLVDATLQLRQLAPDIVYVHQTRNLESQQTALAAAIPTVKFFHDHRPFCLREHKYTTVGLKPCTATLGVGCYGCLGFAQRRAPWFRSLSKLRQELDLYRRLTGAIAGSEYMRDHLLQHDFAAQRIAVIPPSIDIPARVETASRDPNMLLFVGSLVRGKGLDVLLDALPQAPETAHLVIAGQGAQEHALRRQTTRLRLDQRVRFIGQTNQAKLAQLYQRAACVVTPSRTPETFSLVGAEALAHATPVIATAIGGVSAWLRHGETGLAVPPNDPTSLSQAIDSILAYPAWARRMGAQGAALVNRSFTLEQHVTKLLGYFAQLPHRKAA